MKYLLLICVTVCNACYGQVALNNIALTGATIIDANNRTPLAGQTIIIKNDTITQIFADGSKPLPSGINVISVQGKYVIPGLIDTHVHMATDPSGTDNRANTLSVLSRMLYSGITTLRDMAGDARTLAGLARDAQTGDIISPNIYYSALMAGPGFFTDPRTHASTAGLTAGNAPFMLGVTDSTNLVLAVAEAKGTGATGIKLYADLAAGLVNKIVAEATKQGMIVWGHAWLKPAKPTDMVNAGVSSISHAPLLLYDLMDTVPASWKKQRYPANYWDSVVPANMPVFSIMKQHHTILDATLLTYKRWAAEDSAHVYGYELGKRFTAAAYKAGVTICAGTDDDQEAFVQAEMAVLVKDAGFSNFDALVAATLHGAQALHLSNSRGTVEAGKMADLVVLDKNPLDDIANLQYVYLVLKAGKIFKK